MAIANAVPKREVAVVDIGEGFGLLGFEVRPVPVEKDGKEQLHAVLFAIGGRVSDFEVFRAQIASALEPVS